MLIAIAKPNSSWYSLIWMGGFRERVSELIYSLRQSKALSLVVILVLAAAIPLQVNGSWGGRFIYSSNRIKLRIK